MLSNPILFRNCITRGISRLANPEKAEPTLRSESRTNCLLCRAARRKRPQCGISLLGVNEHFEGERKVAFKREQRVLAHYAERSNQKGLNAKNHLVRQLLLFCGPTRLYSRVGQLDEIISLQSPVSRIYSPNDGVGGLHQCGRVLGLCEQRCRKPWCFEPQYPRDESLSLLCGRNYA